MDFHSLQSTARVIKEDWPAGGFRGAQQTVAVSEWDYAAALYCVCVRTWFLAYKNMFISECAVRDGV